jgi:hypothetical protein
VSGLSASSVRDEQLRKAAEKAADFVRDLVKGLSDDDQTMRDIARNGTIGRRVQMPQAITDNLGLKPFLFNIVFEREHHTRSGGKSFQTVAGYDPRSKTLLLFLFPPGYQQDAYIPSRRRSLEAHMLVLLREQRDALVHEITHMLDAQRAPSMFAKPAPQGPAPDDSDAELERKFRSYVNSPHEFNAFFQQMISQASDELTNNTPAKDVRAVEADFEDFMMLIKWTSAYRNIEPYLNTKYRRKLDNRLYQSWNMLHEAAETRRR